MPFRFSSLFRVTVACTVLFATTASQAKADELWYAALHWNGSQSQQRISTIRSIRDDGSYDREVFNLGGDTTYPIPSPEGDWLYFQVGDSPGLQGRYRVHRGRVDGSEVRDLGALHNLGATWTTSRGPSVAGNGSKLMYNVSNGSEDRLIIANPDGTNARFVASELGYSYMGSFDRNGTRIVFANPTRSYELFSQLLSGGALTALTPGTIGNFIPQFTPDDSKIIFKRGFGLSEIWSMTPTGQNQTQLTANSNYGGFYWNTNDEHGSSDWPDISSDGSRIAYVARGPGAVAHVYTMKLDGTDNKQVTNLSGDCARVRFSPDGKRLAFVSFVGSYPQLFVVDALGATSPKQLTNSTVRGCIGCAGSQQP